MSDKLYGYMDWPEIETVVYSEENSPRSILGAQVTEDGILVQCFFPGRDKVSGRGVFCRLGAKCSARECGGGF